MRDILQLVCLIIATTTVSPVAIANTFYKNDFEILVNLTRQAEALERELFDLRKGADSDEKLQTYECLTSISNTLGAMDFKFFEVKDFVGISAVMHDPYDEQIVNHYVSEGVNYGLRSLDLSRQLITLSMAHCSTNATISENGRRVLDFYGSIEYALRQISQRLGL
jgi:hypothetical protein